MKYNPFVESKENNTLTNFRKSVTKTMMKPKNNQVSLTQSLFPSKKNSLKNITNYNNIGLNDFCQTLTSGFGNQWARPQSKHASRRQSNRPETSKGARPYISGTYDTQFLTKQRCSDLTKSPFPSKSMYNCPPKQFDKQNPFQQEEEHKQQFDDKNVKNIRIVVTRNQKPRKQKSIYNDKFQTNLPEDFLSLFAD